jgi:putative phage-type endonuclease
MIEQGTPEWFAQRCGKVTASRIADLMAKTKSGWGASRKNYMAQLVAERVTGTVAESYTNAAMQWGIDTEPMARQAYEAANLVTVDEAGFVEHPKIKGAGASPDGYVGDGLVEIKCPNTATHIDTMLSGKIQDKYIKQMQWQMACTQTAFCDFVSYDPRMGPDLALWVKRVNRDHQMIADIEAAVVDFIQEIDEQVSKLQSITEAKND